MRVLSILTAATALLAGTAQAEISVMPSKPDISISPTPMDKTKPSEDKTSVKKNEAIANKIVVESISTDLSKKYGGLSEAKMRLKGAADDYYARRKKTDLMIRSEITQSDIDAIPGKYAPVVKIAKEIVQSYLGTKKLPKENYHKATTVILDLITFNALNMAIADKLSKSEDGTVSENESKSTVYQYTRLNTEKLRKMGEQAKQTLTPLLNY